MSRKAQSPPLSPRTPNMRSPLRPTSPTPSPLRSSPGSPAPTSSRRLSQNVGSGSSQGHGGPSPPLTAQKARARDLLRKHYGLGIGPPPALGKPDKANLDPMDLDSPSFDAKAYYEQLITTSSLPTLLKRENDLLNEIRELDSERQSLVYNHHHELIAASDTIAAMKARAENLDADMDLLKAAFSEISRLSAEVALERPQRSDQRSQQKPS